MEIKVLGCSGGVGPELRTTSLLIGDRILLDAGTGVCDLDSEQMAALTDIFLTHSHLDHVVGCAFIADNRLSCVASTLVLHAPEATLSALRDHLFNWVLWPDFTALYGSDGSPVIRLEALQPGRPEQRQRLSLTAFPVLHTVPAVGYIISDGSSCVAFTGDTYADDAMWSTLNALPRLDLLIIEVAYPDEAHTVGYHSRHLYPARLATELRKLKHQPELLLSHPKPGVEVTIARQCRKALSGWRYRHLRRGELIRI